LGEDETGVDDLRGTLRPSQAELMGVHPIGRRIGDIRNNDADLLAPLAA